jgi:DNA-binding transcriptional LysR family regulator
VKFLTDLDLFVELAESKHFGRTARSRKLQTSSLSRKIAALERELGVTLINRSTRAFALTPLGAHFYEKAKILVRDAGAIRDQIGAYDLRGKLRIGVTVDMMPIVQPCISTYLKSHDGITVEVSTIHKQPRLIEDALDLGIYVAHQTPLRNSGEITRKIGSFRRQLFASREYLRKASPIREPKDLGAHACLQLDQGIASPKWKLSSPGDSQTVEISGPCIATNATLLAQFARDGLGVAPLAAFDFPTSPCSGRGLVKVLPDWYAVAGIVCAITPAGRPSTSVRGLVELLKADVRSSRMGDGPHLHLKINSSATRWQEDAAWYWGADLDFCKEMGLGGHTLSTFSELGV